LLILFRVHPLSPVEKVQPRDSFELLEQQIREEELLAEPVSTNALESTADKIEQEMKELCLQYEQQALSKSPSQINSSTVTPAKKTVKPVVPTTKPLHTGSTTTSITAKTPTKTPAKIPAKTPTRTIKRTTTTQGPAQRVKVADEEGNKENVSGVNSEALFSPKKAPVSKLAAPTVKPTSSLPRPQPVKTSTTPNNVHVPLVLFTYY
jgi:hypothetical protein